MATDFERFCFLILISGVLWTETSGQDYEVADISCSFDVGNSKGILRATLRKPEGFMGVPIFADDRHTDPQKDPTCQIRPDNKDDSGLLYNLRVNDLSQCGVISKNGFISLRIWFPKLTGVVMMSDQEVIIVCRPAEPVVTSNKAAGFSGQLPPAARVSGIVEESPEKLEYEVALFREFTDKAKIAEVPVDQAVPIGTNLQLRATINTNSAWKHVKLMEVTMSPEPNNAYAEGYITLVRNGCRVEDFYSIVPRQPYLVPDHPGEVRMEFEAVLLDRQSNIQTSQLWIHAKIKACVLASDCVQEFCLDIQQPKGAGKRKKRDLLGKDRILVKSNQLVKRDSVRNFFPIEPKISSSTKGKERKVKENQTTANFEENVGITVVIPRKSQEKLNSSEDQNSTTKGKSFVSKHPSAVTTEECHTFLVVGIVLGSLLVVASIMMCILSRKLFKLSRRYKKEKVNEVVREHRRQFGLGNGYVTDGTSPNLHRPSALMRLQQQRNQLSIQQRYQQSS